MTSSRGGPNSATARPTTRCEIPGARPQSGTMAMPARRASASSVIGSSALNDTSTRGFLASIAACMTPNPKREGKAPTARSYSEMSRAAADRLPASATRQVRFPSVGRLGRRTSATSTLVRGSDLARSDAMTRPWAPPPRTTMRTGNLRERGTVERAHVAKLRPSCQPGPALAGRALNPLSSPPMIEVRELYKAYGSLAAVDGLSFDVRKGETFGLLGPNGAGKTRPMRLLVGVPTPDRGTIQIAGEGDPTRAATRQKLGLAPQAMSLYPDLTGEENLVFFARLHGLTGHLLRERVQGALELAG